MEVIEEETKVEGNKSTIEAIVKVSHIKATDELIESV